MRAPLLSLMFFLAFQLFSNTSHAQFEEILMAVGKVALSLGEKQAAKAWDRWNGIPDEQTIINRAVLRLQDSVNQKIDDTRLSQADSHFRNSSNLMNRYSQNNGAIDGMLNEIDVEIGYAIEEFRAMRRPGFPMFLASAALQATVLHERIKLADDKESMRKNLIAFLQSVQDHSKEMHSELNGIYFKLGANFPPITQQEKDIRTLLVESSSALHKLRFSIYDGRISIGVEGGGHIRSGVRANGDRVRFGDKGIFKLVGSEEKKFAIMNSQSEYWRAADEIDGWFVGYQTYIGPDESWELLFEADAEKAKVWFVSRHGRGLKPNDQGELLQVPKVSFAGREFFGVPFIIRPEP